MQYMGEGVKQDRAVYTMTVIVSTLEQRGSGKDKSDPIRKVTQYYTLDGFLLAENDPYQREVEK